jgi:hypothetical protein
MALPTDEIRSEHAAAVPVYVRALEGSYELVDTASNEVLGTFDTPKQALWQARERADVAALEKRANLRTNGKADGEWRWLDASAAEDDAIGKSRIDDASLWEMAAGLNARKSAIPVNGGGAPEGYVASEPHGDAKNKDGAHPANGWAHLGLIVVETDARTHLYLYAELLPEVAKEVDRGRLAYGSIFFAFESADEEDDYAVSGATLISHALTNDPAVTTLVAGSERHGPSGGHVAYRSRKMSLSKHETIARDAKQTPGTRMRAALEHLAAQSVRGPLAEMQGKVAALLGVTPQEIASNPWALEDSVHALKVAAMFEGKIEASAPPAPAAPTPAEVAAEARSATRAVEGVEPGDEGKLLAAFISLARGVLGKPDASPADMLAELEARKEEIGKVLGTDTPPPAPETESEEADVPELEEEMAADPEEEGKPAAEKPAATPEGEADDEEEDEAAKELRELRADVNELRAREWVRTQIAARKLDRAHGSRAAVGAKEFEKLVERAMKDRDVVVELLDAKNAPPTAHPFDDTREPETQPQSHAEAVAEGGPIWLEAEAMERAKDPVVAKHIIAGRANRLVEQRYPSLR